MLKKKVLHGKAVNNYEEKKELNILILHYTQGFTLVFIKSDLWALSTRES